MSKPCSICRHEKRAEIDKALVARETFRGIAAKYGVSKSSLMRHHDDHLPSSLLKAQAAREAADADALLAQVVELRDKALNVLKEAETSKDWRVALAAIREARGSVELLARLAGELKDSPTINVILSAEWLAVQAAVLTALKPHPEARLAVSSALGGIECVGSA